MQCPGNSLNFGFQHHLQGRYLCMSMEHRRHLSSANILLFFFILLYCTRYSVVIRSFPLSLHRYRPLASYSGSFLVNKAPSEDQTLHLGAQYTDCLFLIWSLSNSVEILKTSPWCSGTLPISGPGVRTLTPLCSRQLHRSSINLPSYFGWKFIWYTITRAASNSVRLLAAESRHTENS